MAFSNLSSAENFNEIKVGIVQDEEYNKNTDFIKAIESVSNSNDSSEKDLFDVQYITKDQGEKLLEDRKIEGYIYFKDGINLVVKETGINETIIKGFIDDFKQTTSAITTIISKNPGAVEKGLFNTVTERENYLKEVPVSKAAPDTMVNYFYSLIAMTCLYGSFSGLKEVTALQANLSSQGARVNMAPIHKMKVFIASVAAATTFQLGELFILLGYLIFVIKISFGNQLGLIALACLVGTITGVTFGTFIAAVVKKGEGIKMGILVSASMVMTFCAGMMQDKIKYYISAKFPIIANLNPASLITDSFYSLYYYNTHTKFFTDIAILCGISVMFSIFTYLVLRRQKYASL